MVSYVPQRPSLLPGTPENFLRSISSFKSRKGKGIGSPSPQDIAREWGIDESTWDRNWSDLSGGEVQRVALAIAVGLNKAQVMLLDEPTSALDLETSSTVETLLVKEISNPARSLKAIIWISHSEEQADRVGTRFLSICDGSCHERARQQV